MLRFALALLLLASPARANDLTDTARTLAKHSAAAWQQFQQPNLEAMRTWWAGRGPVTYPTVFYPFSGPDLANALAFFPDADTYLMFGLEPPGAIPDLHAMSAEAMSELDASLATILQVNYFFTRSMAKKLGTGPVSSITGLLLFFLGTTDAEVVSAKAITVGHDPGVEIAFQRRGRKLQTVRYIQADVSDGAHSDVLAYLKRQGRFATMIKSASYLMHTDKHFDQIRALILAQSDFVVQDDSGVPLRLFARDAWTLRFHGAYEAPTPEFATYLQKDLRVEMHRNSSGKLPFSYGYAYRQGESNLMTAERVP